MTDCVVLRYCLPLMPPLSDAGQKVQQLLRDSGPACPRCIEDETELSSDEVRRAIHELMMDGGSLGDLAHCSLCQRLTMTVRLRASPE